MKRQSYTWLGLKIGVIITITLFLLPLLIGLYNLSSYLGGLIRALFGFSGADEFWRIISYALLIGICTAIGYILDRIKNH